MAHGTTIDPQALDRLLAEVGQTAEGHHLVDLRRAAGGLRRREGDERLRIAFIGEFSTGKSQVVNSLLGEDVLPTAAAPSARLLTEISYSPNPAVTLITADDVEEAIRPEALRDLAALNGYRRARVQSPVDWLRDFVLVDTPGLGEPDDLSAQLVHAELPQADVIVFVLHAQAALKRSERVFLLERLPQHERRKLVFLLNQIDHVPDDEVGPLEDYVRRQLEGMFPHPVLLRYSALDALRGRLEKDKKRLARANFAAVQQALVQDLAADHRRLQQANLLSGLRAALSSAAGDLRRRQDTLRLTLDELSERLDQLEKDTERFDARLDRVCVHAESHLELIGNHLETQLQALRLKVEADLPALCGESDPRQLRKHLPFYLEHLIQGYLDWQEPALTSRLGDLYADIDRELSKAVLETTGGFEAKPGYIASALRTRPASYDRGTQAARVLGIGGIVALVLTEFPIAAVMLLASQTLRVAFRRQREAAERAQMVEAGRRAMNACLERARDELRRQMGLYRSTVVEAIRAEGRARREPVIRSLEEARAARLTAEADRDGPARSWEAALAELEGLLARVDRYEAVIEGE